MNKTAGGENPDNAPSFTLKGAVVYVTAHEITVRIGKIPHLILRRSDVIGLQGYIKNVGPAHPIYFIEISTRSGEITCDYADRKLWEQLLVGLADAKLFDERLGERP